MSNQQKEPGCLVNRVELYEKCYHFELERKERIRESTSMPFGVAVLLFGVTAYLAQRSHEITTGFTALVYGIAICVTLVALVYTVVKLLYSNQYYKYLALPTPDEIERYWMQLVQYYENNPDADGNPNKDFEEYLIQAYSEINSHNDWANCQRAIDLRKAHRALVIALVAAVIAFIPAHYDQAQSLVQLMKSDQIQVEGVMTTHEQREEAFPTAKTKTASSKGD